MSIFCNAVRYAELARNIAELDRTPQLHGEDIQMILATLRQLEETSSWALEVRLV